MFGVIPHVDLRWSDDSRPGKPMNEMNWDGIAEQWFETEEDFSAVYRERNQG